MINIIGVGDIMPGGILSGVNDKYVSQDLRTLMAGADIRVGTLETAVGNEPSFYAEKMSRYGDVIYTLDGDLTKLSYLNIDIVTLANNHFFDLGLDGANHTIQLLDELGVEHIGAGRNLEEASRAVVKYIDGESVAFIAFCDWREESVGWCPLATDTSPGVNPMYDEHVVAEIKKYKAQYDYVVVMPHWGKEHTYITTWHVYKMSKLMIEAGADLILGSHPHRVQPVVNFGRASVAYSMGNFLFPNRLLVPPRSTYYSSQPVDIHKLPSTDGYPLVNELTYKRWKPLALIGMVVSATLSAGSTTATHRLTQMSESGHLSLIENSKIDKRLRICKFLLTYTPYRLTYFAYRVVRALYLRGRRVLQRVKLS